MGMGIDRRGHVRGHGICSFMEGRPELIHSNTTPPFPNSSFAPSFSSFPPPLFFNFFFSRFLTLGIRCVQLPRYPLLPLSLAPSSVSVAEYPNELGL